MVAGFYHYSRNILLLILALWSVALGTSVSAHAIITTSDLGDGFNLVVISGPIVAGDYRRFREVTQGFFAKTVVKLNSSGGALVEGLDIGEMIRAKHFKTVVANNDVCASTCGFIWLAGASRYAGSHAKIGFHAAYYREDGEAKESGSGNALVGAYLSKLNLSIDAILFATMAPPDEIAWLDANDAAKLGIDYIEIPDDPVPVKPSLPATTGSPIEQQMKNLVMRYYAVWSAGGTDVSGLIMFYSDSVNFYGSTRTVAQVIDEKRRFSLRWPNRSYTVQQDTLFVRCDDVCAVSGVVSWDVNSPERGVRSTGSANFVLKVMPANPAIGGLIVSENGATLGSRIEPLSAPPSAALLSPTDSSTKWPHAVMPSLVEPSREGMPPQTAEQQIASSTPRYAEGHQARTVYENWFNALADGPFKDGATFWAGHRSDKPMPSCAAPAASPAWQAGCNASRTCLTPVDLRRKTEKDFWWGWNSL